MDAAEWLQPFGFRSCRFQFLSSSPAEIVHGGQRVLYMHVAVCRGGCSGPAWSSSRWSMVAVFQWQGFRYWPKPCALCTWTSQLLKSELTTQEIFALMSLGDGCPALLLLSSILLAQIGLLYMAADSAANQQAAPLVLVLCNKKCVCSAHTAQRRGVGLSHWCHLFYFGHHQPRPCRQFPLQKAAGGIAAGEQGLWFASKFPSLLFARSNEMPSGTYTTVFWQIGHYPKYFVLS